MAILVGIVVAIGSLVGLFKSGVTSGDGEIAIFVFWGVLALVFSVQLFFMFRNYEYDCFGRTWLAQGNKMLEAVSAAIVPIDTVAYPERGGH